MFILPYQKVKTEYNILMMNHLNVHVLAESGSTFNIYV